MVRCRENKVVSQRNGTEVIVAREKLLPSDGGVLRKQSA